MPILRLAASSGDKEARSLLKRYEDAMLQDERPRPGRGHEHGTEQSREKLLHPEPNGYMSAGMWLLVTTRRKWMLRSVSSQEKSAICRQTMTARTVQMQHSLVASILVLKKGIAGAIGANGRE